MGARMSFSALDLASAHVQAGELDEALRVLNQHLSQFPDDDAARRWRLAVLMHAGDEAGKLAALRELDQMVTPVPDDAIRRSLILQSLGRLDEALDAVVRARERWPDDESLIERLLSLHLLRNDDEHAWRLLSSLPRVWRWLVWAGDIAVESDRIADAIAAYTQALEDLERQFDTDSPFAANMRANLLLKRARALMTNGAFAEAAADFAEAQAIVPDDPMIGFNRGLLALLQGDLVQALALCGEALTAASEVLRNQMERILRGDPRYAPLAMLLLQGDADI